MWFSKSIDQTLQEQGVLPDQGLSSQEAAQRLEKYGKNQLQGKKKKSLLSLFFGQLQDMLIYVLLAAAVITIFIGEYVDAVIILLVVVLNAVIGVIQENKAEKAIEALQQMSAPHALVRRDGEIKEISSQDVVPGDIVILDAGRYVPADLRLIQSAALQIEESALTGESVPTEKDSTKVLEDPKTPIGDLANMAFMSTLVTYGRGEGIAVGTGMDTEMGKIAKILDETEEDMTPLQKKLEELGKMLGYMAIGICVLIFGVSFLQGRDLAEMFLTSISLAVAAIPEGLPAIVAIVLSIGVTKMSKKNAIVKKLPAVETLGCVTVICSDKTGTLTQNKMTVVQFFTGEEIRLLHGESKPTVSPEDLLLAKGLTLCSDATYENGEGTGDPTEIALLLMADQLNIDRKKLLADYPRIAEYPFDSDRKCMSTLHKRRDSYRIFTKGAIDTILPLCQHVLLGGEVLPFNEDQQERFLMVSESMSDSALRVLALAYRDVKDVVAAEEMEESLTLIGLVGMIDPPRLEVKDSISEAKKAGIRPIMITGDHKNTAVAIAKELGIAEHIDQSLTGTEINEFDEEDFAEQINQYRVFARVSPEHKVKIVKAFQAHGNIVSMTGDGVNDAPALKTADIGVAMGITGTDVSKGAADMILRDDNFTTIVHAIEEGRNIYNNIKKSVLFLLTCNLGEIVTIFFSILMSWPVPLIATQILWINLVTDSLPAIALGMDPGSNDVMDQPPRDPKESFFAGGILKRVILGGLLIGLLTLGAFYFGLMEEKASVLQGSIPEHAIQYARTMAFMVLVMTQLFYSLALRHPKKSIFQIGLFSNMKLIGAIVVGFLLQIIVIAIPPIAAAFKLQMLSVFDWFVVILLGMVPLMVNEGIKFFGRMEKADQSKE